MSYTLATAAEAAGVGKPTMWRWVKAGRLSATRLDDGSYRIDPAELDRFLSSIKETPAPQRSATDGDAPAETGLTIAETIALRSEVDKLRALLDAEKQRADEIKADRDRWAAQAERLALPRPETTGNASNADRRGWWPFRRTG